jgi:hypothetical protein
MQGQNKMIPYYSNTFEEREENVLNRMQVIPEFVRLSSMIKIAHIF